jgi:hypothetical protein
MTLESLQISSKINSSSIPNFDVINDRARGFHSALDAGWECKCASNHIVNLRLEPRIEGGDSEDSDDEELMKDPFHGKSSCKAASISKTFC